MTKSLAALFLLLVAQTGLGQTLYTIEGTVTCPETGTLFIYLVDEQRFSVPFSGIDSVERIVETEQVGVPLSFRFAGVPAGRYAIRCYLDRNGNGRLDRGIFGPSEPWAFAGQEGKLRGRPRFRDVSFPVHEDRSGIRIRLAVD